MFIDDIEELEDTLKELRAQSKLAFDIAHTLDYYFNVGKLPASYSLLDRAGKVLSQMQVLVNDLNQIEHDSISF